MKINTINYVQYQNQINFEASKKYTWKKAEIKDPKLAFNIFESRVIKAAKQNKLQDKSKFYKELSRICTAFQTNNNIETANKYFKRLAETLVSLSNHDFASVIYSKLLKLNPNNKQIQEECSHSAKKNAYRMQDWIHTLARCCNLKQIYKDDPNKEIEYKKNLYEIKNCLKKICSQYELAKKQYKRIHKPIRSIFVYKNMLGLIYTEIANVVQKENKNESKKCLEKALEIFQEVGNVKKIKSVENILKKLK